MPRERLPSEPDRKASDNSGGARLSAQAAAGRVIIERVAPEIDCGRFPVKRILGAKFDVSADIFSDGHDALAAALRFRAPDARSWFEMPMSLTDNDRWSGDFALERLGRYDYSVVAWRDVFATWRAGTRKKQSGGLDVAVEFAEGTRLVENAADAADANARPAYANLLKALKNNDVDDAARLNLLLSDDVAGLLARTGPRADFSRYPRVLGVLSERPRAANAAWYELTPRSQAGDAKRHGTFDDVIARLPYVRDLGFDVLYLTPIHPIGGTNRKGVNNSLVAGALDPGSPYAIGSSEGGHDAIHPQLGNFEDFARLIDAVKAAGMEIALDFAIQCSPDHPWVREHPEWFDWRPDGTIKFAENPPKKYEDIVNVHFHGTSFPALWHALRDIVLFWIGKGVTIFRVDNPHTKPVPFWEWLIRDIQTRHRDVIFLAEAFTRPKMMKRLAKIGFTQSYSYFTWRNTKQELTEYLTELTTTEAGEYMRPNFFANTPDINPFFLQAGGRAAFQIRLALAALLNPLYGIYSGFELCENDALPGKEEYNHSEKYEIKAWDWDRFGNIKEDVRVLNRIRREQPALRAFTNLRFYNFFNENVLYFGKLDADRRAIILVAISLDPKFPQEGAFEVPLWEFGLTDAGSVDVEDLIEGHRFRWTGKLQFLRIDPQHRPYFVWRIAAIGGGL